MNPIYLIPPIKKDPKRYINLIESMKESFSESLTDIQKAIITNKDYNYIIKKLNEIDSTATMLKQFMSAGQIGVKR